MRNVATNEYDKLVDDHAVLFERLLPGSMGMSPAGFPLS